jgi:hypothetical protein
MLKSDQLTNDQQTAALDLLKEAASSDVQMDAEHWKMWLADVRGLLEAAGVDKDDYQAD